MKRYLVSIMLLLAVQQIVAGTFHKQLTQFNYNWQYYPHQAPGGEAQKFATDNDLVYAHLTHVIPILQSNTTSHLSNEALQMRQHLITVLDDYRTAKNFPTNYYRHERIPVFIDELNTHCAVAYLLLQSGNDELAQRIANTNNYAWLRQINDADFVKWQMASGLSMHELKLIQGAYDHYLPNALVLANRYEVPQKPACIKIYFENQITNKPMPQKPENIWCMGEGNKGKLHGQWVQNYAVGKPWIVGYYENGNRTGQWEEYYQGTAQLCRTENWRHDKLNGIRKRFSRTGVLIEEILFSDGIAVTKTNYDYDDSLTWIRKPLDSNLVHTQVFTFGGALIASGHERVHNPGNLLWFQNIELTALNSAAITSRSVASQNNFIPNNGSLHFATPNLYNTPPLVEYKKEGNWKYYIEYQYANLNKPAAKTASEMLAFHYKHFGKEIAQSIALFDLKAALIYDSVQVAYNNNQLQNFYGYAKADVTHLHIRYYNASELKTGIRTANIRDINYRSQAPKPNAQVKELGQYDKSQKRIGIWKHYDKHNKLYKTENYLFAFKEEEE